jgi:RimJ/RimL family protein N-acetyltransferase
MTAYRMLLGADDDVGAWVSSRLAGEWSRGYGRAIGVTSGETLVAGIVFAQYNGCNVWVGIASEDPGWCNRRFLSLLFDYPFRQLQAKRITALIDASNARSIDFTSRLGFSHEATLEASAPNGGDQLVYRMKAEDCRWLRTQHEQRKGRQTAEGA